MSGLLGAQTPTPSVVAYSGQCSGGGGFEGVWVGGDGDGVRRGLEEGVGVAVTARGVGVVPAARLLPATVGTPRGGAGVDVVAAHAVHALLGGKPRRDGFSQTAGLRGALRLQTAGAGNTLQVGATRSHWANPAPLLLLLLVMMRVVVAVANIRGQELPGLREQPHLIPGFIAVLSRAGCCGDGGGF